ncbi:MAG TPA: alkaline phosphatase family protein [Candidatus Limnocylindrales bacterium]|nr:alkaline phosphatase family protein [Candidatus Limnocylindrales bacterium]
MDGPYRARDWRLRFALIGLAAVVAVAVVAGGLALRSARSGPGAGSTPSPTQVAGAGSAAPSAVVSPPGPVRRAAHVWLIMLENKEYTSLLGNPAAPYFNSLAARYGLATNYYATGHPSQPNYVALVAGSIAGVTADTEYHLNRASLFSQLADRGEPWRVYAQDVPTGCFTGASATGLVDGPGAPGPYARKHNPAISFTSVADDPAQCANIQPLANFDPAAGAYEFIVPNLINDMHNGTIAQGDAFLSAFVPLIIASPAFTAGGVLFITFDEGSTKEGLMGDAGGHVATLVIATTVPAGDQFTAYADHSSVLRTTEDLLGLPCLGLACQRDPIAW